ncbi:MAG: hypothetical protein ACFWUJ_11865 [Pseudomonas fragi]
MATKQITKLFAAMVLAGFASHSFAADTIKIGIAGPKTGPLTQYGDMQFAGAKWPSNKSTPRAALMAKT